MRADQTKHQDASKSQVPSSIPSMPGGETLDLPWRLDLSLSAPDRIHAIFAEIDADPGYSGWDARLLRKSCKLISATADPATAIFEVTIEPYLCNLSGFLHGGAASTILDNLTSTIMHVAARKGLMEFGSVSRTLTVTFLRPVPMWAKVRIEVEMVSPGRTLAHVRGEIKDMEGKVCVSCVHDKAVRQAPRL